MRGKEAIIALLFAFFMIGCKAEITDGRITEIKVVQPYNKQFSCGYWIGKIYHPKTCYTYVDTTYYIVFEKQVGTQTRFRQIQISKSAACSYKHGDYIHVKNVKQVY